LDEEAILKSLEKTKCIVTAEEHNILGGLGKRFKSFGIKQSSSTRVCCSNDSSENLEHQNN
jgi:transketolase